MVQRKRKSFICLSAALPALLAASGWAAKWEVTPSVGVGEIYTDNVLLTQDDARESDWLTQIVPGIQIAGRGSGLKLDAAYQPELLYSATGARNDEVYHRGHADGVATLADHLLFLDFGAKVDQYDASLQGPRSVSNSNATGNRTSVSTLSISPYLQHSFGSQTRVEARFTQSRVDSDALSSGTATESNLTDSNADRINLTVESGPAFRLLTWRMTYVREDVDYKSAADADSKSEIASANFRRLVSPTVGLLAQVGYDNYHTGAGTSASEGVSWGLGAEWVPSLTTRVAAMAGHRFYGDSYLVNLRHRTRLTTWSLDYSESVTNARSEFFVAPTASTTGILDTLFSARYGDPEMREKAVSDFVASTGMPAGMGAPLNFFSSSLFLVKRLQASAGVLGVRNVVLANAYREASRELDSNQPAATQGDFAASSAIVQTGTGAIWNWRIFPRLASNVTAAYSRSDFEDSGRVDDQVYLGMGLARQLQPGMYASVNLRRQQNRSNRDEFSYTENAVFATLQKRF